MIASDGVRLTPREAALRRFVRATVAPTLRGDLPLEVSRRRQERLARTVPVRRRTEVRRGSIAGVPVEVLRPSSGGTDAEHLLLYVHGGGFLVGSPRTHRMVTAALAHEARATVVVPDYRLAPEHPFPAASDDVRAVHDVLAARGARRLTVAGDSAGGNLALGLAATVRGPGDGGVDAIGAISPLVDLSVPAGSWDDADDALLSRAGGERLAADYLAAGTAWDDPRVAVHLGELAGLPPTLLQVGGAEALADDTRAYADAAAAVDADVHVQVWPGMWHVHQVLAGLLPAADRALADLGRFLATGELPSGAIPAGSHR